MNKAGSSKLKSLNYTVYWSTDVCVLEKTTHSLEEPKKKPPGAAVAEGGSVWDFPVKNKNLKR